MFDQLKDDVSTCDSPSSKDASKESNDVVRNIELFQLNQPLHVCQLFDVMLQGSVN